MPDKALFQFTIGVFGLAARIVDGTVRIKVNIRTDQARQWKAAKLDPILDVWIVDCPGGAVWQGETLLAALAREILEETGGCEIKVMGGFSPPLAFLNADLTKPSDMAIWAPVVIIGDPKPSNEALGHPWISRAEFEDEKPYRCVSGLGNKGRTGQMMRQALDFYERKFAAGEIEFFTFPARDIC